MLSRIKIWWEQRNCRHWHQATQTWFEHGAVHRRTKCLQCGKDTPCPPISDNEMMSLLDAAKLAERKD